MPRRTSPPSSAHEAEPDRDRPRLAGPLSPLPRCVSGPSLFDAPAPEALDWPRWQAWLQAPAADDGAITLGHLIDFAELRARPLPDPARERAECEHVFTLWKTVSRSEAARELRHRWESLTGRELDGDALLLLLAALARGMKCSLAGAEGLPLRSVLELLERAGRPPETREHEGENAPPAPAPEGRKARAALIAEYLCRNPSATADQVSRAIGVPASTVRKHRAWTDHQKSLPGRRSIDALERRHGPIVVEAAAPGPATVLDELVEQEDREAAVRARYLDGASPEQRAEFHQMGRDEQKSHLDAFDMTGGMR